MHGLNKILILPILLLFSGCATDTPIFEPNSSYIINGCLIDAVNLQAELLKRGNTTGRVISIHFYQNGEVLAHAMCVFRAESGTMYAYDRRGYFKLTGNGNDPMEVAKQLFSSAVRAWYE